MARATAREEPPAYSVAKLVTTPIATSRNVAPTAKDVTLLPPNNVPRGSWRSKCTKSKLSKIFPINIKEDKTIQKWRPIMTAWLW